MTRFALQIKTICIALLVILFAILVVVLSRHAQADSGIYPILDTPTPEIAISDSFILPLNMIPVYNPTPKPIPKSIASSCVLYAKSLTGYTKIIGLAKNWEINSKVPEVGAVVVFKYNHVAVITEMASSSFNITEANYVSGHITSRSLQFGDKSIQGYYIQM